MRIHIDDCEVTRDSLIVEGKPTEIRTIGISHLTTPAATGYATTVALAEFDS